MTPKDFTQHFENKTETELAAMSPPPGLSAYDRCFWQKAHDAALDAAHRANVGRRVQSDAANAPAGSGVDPFSAVQAEVEGKLAERESMDRTAPAKDRTSPQPLLTIPEGNVADLLERQVGICAALIGNVADFVAHNTDDQNVNFFFMDRISSLLASSASAARVVGQLRGIPSEVRQTFVKKDGGGREGGVPRT